MKNNKRIAIPIAMLAIALSSLVFNNALEKTNLLTIIQVLTIGILLGVLLVNVFQKG